MEKWAKAMNAQKDALKEEQRKITTAAGRKESAAADAGFAILQKSVRDPCFVLFLFFGCVAFLSSFAVIESLIRS